MSEYLKKLMKIIEISDENINGMMVVNKDGIVEYYRPGTSLSASEIPDFTRDFVGHHVLDLYPELTEKNSTVVQTLRTGETISGQRQVFTWKDCKLTLMTTTYPIMEGGRIEGAVDVARVIELKKNGVTESVDKGLYRLDDIITQNQEMERLKETVRNVAKSNSPVLVYGETGTGKELVAESLHTLSGRAGRPFISQNCAAIPENLLESIFFGTEKGSFTGAESKKGIFEMADGGTLFLDEINSMELAMQAKLLKALEEQKARRIGGKADIRFDVRIVCAANKDPDKMVESGSMRADLYYRISVVKLWIPPLRERPEDILLLAKHFIGQYNQKMGRNICGINLMAEQLFTKWRWPGNIRELRNTIESAFNIERSDSITLDSVQDLLRKVNETAANTFTGDCAGVEGLPPELRSKRCLQEALDKGRIDLKEILDQCETYLIKETLKIEPKLKAAAEKLSMSPQKLQYRLDKLRLRKK